jgi:hypothetical protein
LNNFETCPKRYWHYSVGKDVVEVEGPQIIEGKELHQVFADRLSKGAALPLGYGQHERILAPIAASPGKVYTERKLAITSAFTPCGWFAKDVWFRTVIDCVVLQGGFASLFDWKNGRPKADATQLQLMSAVMFHHAGELQRIRSALVFVQHNHVEREEFVRGDLPEIWNDILPRVRRLEKARREEEFPAKPGGLCKRYCAVVSCPYHGG